MLHCVPIFLKGSIDLYYTACSYATSPCIVPFIAPKGPLRGSVAEFQALAGLIPLHRGTCVIYRKLYIIFLAIVTHRQQDNNLR